eukprot:7608104-Pyramimonas_sp.AAC.1
MPGRGSRGADQDGRLARDARGLCAPPLNSRFGLSWLDGPKARWRCPALSPGARHRGLCAPPDH